ncbi:hypothetical protein [Hypericibacter sp.]|uniref:hypothetical protein n=1 Tax=Hypericibacter sp. TaxID=2705401 RepID=UPI003D6C7E3D
MQKIYGERTFRKRADGNYDFINYGLFVWPYILTDEQRTLIERKVVQPSDWMTSIALLVLIAVITVGCITPTSFGDLFGFCLMSNASIVILASSVWPLIWVKMRLQKAPRHSRPFYLPPPFTSSFDASAMVCRAPALFLWAGMLICFGASGLTAVCAARDLTRGALEQGWSGVGGSLFFVTWGLICLLRWWGRPKDWAPLKPDGTTDLRIIKMGQPKPKPSGSDRPACEQ